MPRNIAYLRVSTLDQDLEKNKADSYQMLSYALPAYIDKLDLQELPGAGHFIQEEMPVETAEFISTFLG